MIAPPDPAVVTADVAAALAEDLGEGDLSAQLIEPGRRLAAEVVSRGPGVLAGAAWFEAAFVQLDRRVEIDWRLRDGAPVEADCVLCQVAGPARALLSAERTALNFLQLLSGTATLTHRYAEALAGTGVTLLDTRKTIPGLRCAQKYAVRAGGGSNHRFGLFDAILIKENHLAASGGIRPAVTRARALHPGMPVEVEVENLEELGQAVAAGAERALLDNFPLPDLRRAARRYREAIELEASGNITCSNLRAVAATGVHFISSGELTKRVEPLDLSMRFA